MAKSFFSASAMNFSASATVPLPGSTAVVPGLVFDDCLQEGCSVMDVKTSMIDPIAKRLLRSLAILIPYLGSLRPKEAGVDSNSDSSWLPESCASRCWCPSLKKHQCAEDDERRARTIDTVHEGTLNTRNNT